MESNNNINEISFNDENELNNTTTNEVSFNDGEKNSTSNASPMNLFDDIGAEGDDEEVDSTELFALANKIIKRNSKPDMIWEKYDCGGIDCHGKRECQIDNCQCDGGKFASKNFPLLRSLCQLMLQMGYPHRVNNEEGWSNFADFYFNTRENEIPMTLRGNNLDNNKRKGVFLKHQWKVAKSVYMKSNNNETKTPFLLDCKRVIEDKLEYERQVKISFILYTSNAFETTVVCYNAYDLLRLH